MKDFWKEEVQLFKQDIENIWDFLFQPVTFGSKKEQTLSLKPNGEEVIEKAEAIANNDEIVEEMSQASVGFWAREFDQMKKDVENVWDFLFQPVKFK